MAANVLVCITVILFSVISAENFVKDENNSDIINVLRALDNVMTFLKENYKHLNLDGYFGLRVMQGQLQMILSQHKASPHVNLSPDIVNHIENLALSANNVCTLGLKYVENDDPHYFSNFKTIVLSPWMIKKPPRKLQPNLRWEIPQYKAKLKVKLNEELSDKCIGQLLQTNCNISDDCAEVMTTRGLTGYGITHQLLWTAIGEEMPNCSFKINNIMENHGFGNISQMQLEWCTNNFYEMVAIVQVLMHGKIHEGQQDLFFEQQFVCPSLGFYEFLKKDYLKQMLTWQFPVGCFGDKEKDEQVGGQADIDSLLMNYREGREHFLHNKVNTSHSLVSKFLIDKDVPTTQDNEKADNGKKLEFVQEINKKINSENLDKNMRNNSSHSQADKFKAKLNKWHNSASAGEQVKTQRHLLTEKVMEDGCLSHKTGVAVGALCTYLRYLMEPGDIQWTGQHELFLMDMRSLLQADVEGQVKSENGEGDINNNGGDVLEAAADNNEEGDEEEEEEGDEEEEYNQAGEDYRTDQLSHNKAEPENPVIQFGPRDNDNIMVNEDNEKELIEYSNVHDEANPKQQLILPDQIDNNVEDTREQQEDHNYYDDDGETEKGIIKRKTIGEKIIILMPLEHLLTDIKQKLISDDKKMKK
ncbi:hypothetical protein Btru_002763 [Bulinus truncatus]|nr:hypothetical protein Btru_002763 [Bulinus truncatus]